MNGTQDVEDRDGDVTVLLRARAAAGDAGRPDDADTVRRLGRDAVAAVRRADRRRNRRRLLMAGMATCVVVGSVAAAVPATGARFAQVDEPSAAMEPTVALGGSVTIDREAVPAPFDVVVLHRPTGGLSISRVVATAGRTVSCPDAGDGTCRAVRVDGVALDEPYVGGPTAPFAAVVVPAGAVFVLGDNRPVSLDSRQVGPVAVSTVEGVAVRVATAAGPVPVPGAPHRDGPADGARVDPAEAPGPVGVAPAGP